MHRRGKVASELDKVVESYILWTVLTYNILKPKQPGPLFTLQRSKSKQLSVGPVLLGFFLFVVVGSGQANPRPLKQSVGRYDAERSTAICLQLYCK